MIKGGDNYGPKLVSDVLVNVNQLNPPQKKELCQFCNKKIDFNGFTIYKSVCCNKLFHFCCAYLHSYININCINNRCNASYSDILAKRMVPNRRGIKYDLSKTVKFTDDYPLDFLRRQTIDNIFEGLYQIIKKKDPYGKESDMSCIYGGIEAFRSRLEPIGSQYSSSTQSVQDSPSSAPSVISSSDSQESPSSAPSVISSSSNQSSNSSQRLFGTRIAQLLGRRNQSSNSSRSRSTRSQSSSGQSLSGQSSNSSRSRSTRSRNRSRSRSANSRRRRNQSASQSSSNSINVSDISRISNDSSIHTI